MRSRRPTKAERLQIYSKFGGRCAYCGRKIEYKDMQVDHIIPVCTGIGSYLVEHWEPIEIFNPSCRSCNHYKRSWDLESFRKNVTNLYDKIQKDYMVKIALHYGLLKIGEPFCGTFLFERENSKKEVEE